MGDRPGQTQSDLESTPSPMSVPEDEGYLLPPPEMTTTLSVEVLRIVKRDTRNSGGNLQFLPGPCSSSPACLSQIYLWQAGGAGGQPPVSKFILNI